DHLNLEVRRGEIVGIAGVDGNGQTELIEAITGLTKVESGTITLKDKNITKRSPRKVTESGLAHIPQDRHKFGLVLDFSVGENIALQTYYQEPFSKYGVLNLKKIYKKAEHLIDEYDTDVWSTCKGAWPVRRKSTKGDYRKRGGSVTGSV